MNIDPKDAIGANAEIKDFVATVVVKTARARRIKDLCGLQTVPVRNSHPQIGSLVCAAVNGGHVRCSGEALILKIRPLSWCVLSFPLDQEPYRVILLAIPNEEFGMISSQVERIEPILVNGDTSCPSEKNAGIPDDCIWKAIGGYYERGV